MKAAGDRPAAAEEAVLDGKMLGGGKGDGGGGGLGGGEVATAEEGNSTTYRAPMARPRRDAKNAAQPRPSRAELCSIASPRPQMRLAAHGLTMRQRAPRHRWPSAEWRGWGSCARRRCPRSRNPTRGNPTLACDARSSPVKGATRARVKVSGARMAAASDGGGEARRDLPYPEANAPNPNVGDAPLGQP